MSQSSEKAHRARIAPLEDEYERAMKAWKSAHAERQSILAEVKRLNEEGDVATNHAKYCLDKAKELLGKVEAGAPARDALLAAFEQASARLKAANEERIAELNALLGKNN